jgi:folate-binding protein YgfZ
VIERIAPSGRQEAAAGASDLFDEEGYTTLRRGVGVFPARRDVLRVSGPDAVEYLQGQCSQDVAALAVGESADALVLSPQGKLDALVRVVRVGDDAFVVDTEGGFGPAVAARLERFKLRVKVVIEALPWRCVSLRGPATPAGEAALRSDGVLAVPFSWQGVTGVDLLGDAPQVPAGVRLCAGDAWESVRVEAGIPVMGAELDDKTIAAEAGLLERCVSFTKGCYTGQELVARLDARGNRVARHLRGIVLGPLPDGLVRVPVGSDVVTQETVVGAVTSSAWSPALGGAVALAYVHRKVEPPAEVEVRVGGDPGSGPTFSVAGEVRALPLVG